MSEESRLIVRSQKSWRRHCKLPMLERSSSRTPCYRVRPVEPQHRCRAALTNAALGLMFLQLLNLGPLFSLAWSRLFAKTPRDHAEANAPPMLNYGWVYPQALLIFTITLVYSVVSPLILIFGAIYFGVACEWLICESLQTVLTGRSGVQIQAAFQ